MKNIFFKKSVVTILLVSLSTPTLTFAQTASSTLQNASSTQSASTTEWLLATEEASKSISERIEGKSAKERARIKSLEFTKLSFPNKETVKSTEFEIKDIVDIPGGIQLYVRAWKNKKPLGFGQDATIEWERFRFFNPPILAKTNKKSTKRWTDEAGRTVSVTAYEYEENPRLALLQMIEDTIRIVGKDGNKIISGKRGHTTSTFYPDSDPETGSVDGKAYIVNANTTWSAIHDASVGGGAADNETSSANFSSVEATNASNVWNSIGRAYFLFNTSAIPDTDSVSAATFSVYVEGKSDSFTDAIALVDVNPASNINIVAADYSQVGTIKQATNISISSIATSAYNDWTLNSYGKASVSKAGVTKFGLRNEMDRANAPIWVSNGISRIYGRYADYSGTTSDPKLVVTHSSTPITPTIIQNIIYTYDANGNITRIADISDTDTAKVVDYTYDDLNRLTRASSSGALYTNYVHAFNYDAIGNIASSTLASSSTLTGATELYSTSLYNDANLVAYYRFEGNSNDNKGSNNGSDTSISYASSTGKFSQGASFGGSSRIDLSSLPVNSQNVTASIVFWAKTSSTSRQRFMDIGSCDITKDCIQPEIYNTTTVLGDFAAYSGVSGGSGVTDNVWHHFAYTVDGGATYKLYVDGILKDTKTTTGLRITNAGTNTKRIGQSYLDNHGFGGAMDDVAFFNRVLSGSEISALVNGTEQFASSTVYLYNSTSTNVYANPHAVTSIGGVSYSYDNNGNLTSDSTWNHTWNYRNRLTQSSSSNALVTYLYDFADTRVRMISPSTTLIVATPNYSMGNSTSTKHFYANGELVATVRGSGASSTSYYVVTDHLGSAEKTISASGTIIALNEFYPYGDTKIETGQDYERKSYLSVDKDQATDLVQAGSRYYKSSVGRFMSQDPVFWALGDQKQLQQLTGFGQNEVLSNPQILNSYSYAGNNPITYKDPDGKFVPLLIGGIFLILDYYGYSVLANEAMDAYVKNSNPQVFSAEQREKANTIFATDAAITVIGEGAGLAGAKIADKALDVLSVIGDANDVWRQNQAEKELENPNKKKKQDIGNQFSNFPGGVGGSLFAPNLTNQATLNIQNQQSNGASGSQNQIQLLQQLLGLYQQLLGLQTSVTNSE